MDKNSLDRRQIRHMRRVRNQVLCWVGLVIMIAILGLGSYAIADTLGRKLSASAAGTGKDQQPVQEAVSENEPEQGTEVSENGGVISAPDPIDEIIEETGEITEEEIPEEEKEILARLEGMSIEQKIDGLFIVSPEAITGVATATMAGDGTREALNQYAVAGVVYSAKNVVASDQFKELVSTTKSMYREIYNHDMLALVDEEGGFATLGGHIEEVDVQPSARELAETGNRDNVTESYEAIASYLKEYGIDVNIAPQAAVKTVENAFLADRVFSDDADIAASMTAAAVEGLDNGGVLSCLASFPGEGGTVNNPDVVAINTEKNQEELAECEYKPFVSGIEAGADMIMVSNIVASNAGSGEDSCSMSEEIITNVLRNELGFEGVIVSAPLDQPACTAYVTPGAAALKSFIAGTDLIYVRSALAFNEARDALLGAIEDGTISEELVDKALMRVYTMESKL